MTRFLDTITFDLRLFPLSFNRGSIYIRLFCVYLRDAFSFRLPPLSRSSTKGSTPLVSSWTFSTTVSCLGLHLNSVVDRTLSRDVLFFYVLVHRLLPHTNYANSFSFFQRHRLLLSHCCNTHTRTHTYVLVRWFTISTTRSFSPVTVELLFSLSYVTRW